MPYAWSVALKKQKEKKKKKGFWLGKGRVELGVESHR